VARHAALELRVVPEANLGLDQHGQPVAVRLRDRAQCHVDALLGKQARVAKALGAGELDGEVERRPEVVEERPPRRAGLPLEAGDGRAGVAVPRECAARALEDLGPTRVEVLLADLRHSSTLRPWPTLQNRTDVLLSRDAPESLARRAGVGGA